VSFSNVQQFYGLPIIFVGLTYDSVDESRVKCGKTKESLFPHPSDYPAFDLSSLEHELEGHQKRLLSYKVINLKTANSDETVSDQTNWILGGVLKTVEALISSNVLGFFEGIKTVYAHTPIDNDGKQLIIQETLEKSHPVFKYPIVFQGKGNFNQLMEVARLFALDEYLRVRRVQRSHIYSHLMEGNRHFQQITEVHWKSPDIRHYPDSFVGYPELIVKSPKEASKTPLVPGHELSIFPIARFCLGVTQGLQIENCMRARSERPFGLLTNNSERCAACTKKSEYIRCLSRKPKCDGSVVCCNNSGFAGRICNGDFSIYITIFGDTLKVGRAIFSRSLARLLEQSAYDALVFYPINSMAVSHSVEKEVADFLRKKIARLKPYGIRKVVRSVRQNKRLEHVRHISGNLETAELNKRKDAYEEARTLLGNFESPGGYPFFALESRRVELSQNWFIDGVPYINNAEFVKDIQFKRIGGKIDGIVGSFIFLDRKVYDFESLMGFVIECQ
jgi:hypothetical protein